MEVNGDKVKSFSAAYTAEALTGDGLVVRRGKKNFRRVVIK